MYVFVPFCWEVPILEEIISHERFIAEEPKAV